MKGKYFYLCMLFQCFALGKTFFDDKPGLISSQKVCSLSLVRERKVENGTTKNQDLTKANRSESRTGLITSTHTLSYYNRFSTAHPSEF